MLELPKTIENEDIKSVLSHFSDGGPEPCLDCGPGWNKIIVALNKVLQEAYPNYEVYQVKEKFGELRFYTNLPFWEEGESPSLAARAILEAERLSCITCEICGDPGVKGKISGVLLRVLCEQCAPNEFEKVG